MDIPQHLLAEIACGNEAAFKVFFDNYREKIYLYLLKITKSKEIAEEILLDIFLKLWLGREMLHEINDLDAFLHKVAYNKAIDFFRIAARNKKLQNLLSREMNLIREKEADHKLLEKEYNIVLNDVLDQLSPQRRLIFSLSRI